ncbi:8-oxoguanine deaminase [candidate division KSB1 bacterium]|nr:MAG: 8-oxoguanine deaminase [candidate division KSB1 bacterium]
MGSLLLRNVDALYQRSGVELHGADVLIRDREIAAIGANLSAPEARVFDCRGKVALPGLVNTHHHFFQTMTRCLPGAQNDKLFEWLVYHYKIWKYVRPETVEAATRLAMAELMLTGCTTTSDHQYLFPRGMGEDLMGLQVAAAKDMGVRFCGTRGSMTLGEADGGLPPDDLVESDEKVLRESEEVIRRWHDASPFSMCQIHLAPCSPFNVTQALLAESAKLARKYKVRLHTHLAETLEEIIYCKEKYHKRPLQFMIDLGWTGDHVWYAHGIYFTDSELDQLALMKTGIAHCPSSNMRLGSGAARIPDMIARGIPVGLAVDGSASNDSSDMLGELRQAMLLGRVTYGSDALTARQVISLATEGSAAVLGRKEIGVIEVGKAADIAIFDLDQLQYAGAADPIAALLFCGYNHTAWAVIVNGEIVVENGHLTRADEEQIKRNAQREAKALWQRAGVC